MIILLIVSAVIFLSGGVLFDRLVTSWRHASIVIEQSEGEGIGHALSYWRTAYLERELFGETYHTDAIGCKCDACRFGSFPVTPTPTPHSIPHKDCAACRVQPWADREGE